MSRLMSEGTPSDVNYLYIMELTGQLVKVGHSRDVGVRIRNIETDTGRRVLKTYVCEVTLGEAFDYESLLVEAVKHHSSFYLEFPIGGTYSTEYFLESDEFWGELYSKIEELGLQFLDYK